MAWRRWDTVSSTRGHSPGSVSSGSGCWRIEYIQSAAQKGNGGIIAERVTQRSAGCSGQNRLQQLFQNEEAGMQPEEPVRSGRELRLGFINGTQRPAGILGIAHRMIQRGCKQLHILMPLVYSCFGNQPAELFSRALRLP